MDPFPFSFLYFGVEILRWWDCIWVWLTWVSTILMFAWWLMFPFSSLYFGVEILRWWDWIWVCWHGYQQFWCLLGGWWQFCGGFRSLDGVIGLGFLGSFAEEKRACFLRSIFFFFLFSRLPNTAWRRWGFFLWIFLWFSKHFSLIFSNTKPKVAK